MSDSDTLVGIVISGSWVDMAIHSDAQTINFSDDLSNAETIADHLRPLAPNLVVVEDAEGVAAHLAGMLYDAGFPVVMVHARHAHLTGDGPERARMLARFAGGIRPEFRKDAQKLSEWVACRRGQMALIEAEKKRLTRVSRDAARHIQANIAHLERESERMAEALSKRILPGGVWRVRDNLLIYEGEARKAQGPAKRRPMPYVPYLHAWVRPHLRKAAKWSLLGHLLFFLICGSILRLIPEQRPHRTVRLLMYSNLMPPPSLIAETEKKPAPAMQSPSAVPPKAAVGKEYVFQSTVKARRTGTPVAVKNAAVPEKEEWKPSGQEFPADEDLVVRKSSFRETRSGISVRQDLSSQRRLADANPPVPEERRAPKPEQGGRQRVTLRLSLLGGYAGVSGKIAYIQRTIGDMDRASFSFRDASVHAVKREASVRFGNGRMFAVYFGSDWKLGSIEMDMESGASDRDRETEALKAIDFLERALKSQSS